MIKKKKRSDAKKVSEAIAYLSVAVWQTQSTWKR
jgi:hypothetical protein